MGIVDMTTLDVELIMVDCFFHIIKRAPLLILL